MSTPSEQPSAPMLEHVLRIFMPDGNITITSKTREEDPDDERSTRLAEPNVQHEVSPTLFNRIMEKRYAAAECLNGKNWRVTWSNTNELVLWRMLLNTPTMIRLTVKASQAAFRRLTAKRPERGGKE